MRKLLFSLCLLAALAVPAFNQVTSQNARRLPDKNGVPSGSCVSGPPFVEVQFDVSTTPPTLYACKSGSFSKVTAGTTPGNVVGAASSTDNAAARFDATTGKLVQNSGVIIDDSNNVSGAASLSVSGNSTVNGLSNGCLDAGANDTYACNLSPAITSYVTGAHYRFKANTANTGAASINFNSKGALTIVKVGGGITTALADSDILAGQWVECTYDGTNCEMASPSGNALSYDVAVSYDGVPSASSVIRIVAPRAFNPAASWVGTICSAGTAATAQTDFIVAVNGATKATLRFAASGTTCSIVSPTTVSISVADVITITSPGTPDATLANIAISVKGALP